MPAVGDADLHRRGIGQRSKHNTLGRTVCERTGQDRHAEPGPDQSEDGQHVPGFVRDRGCKPGLGTRPQDELVKRWPCVGCDTHKRIRPEIGEFHPSRMRPGVTGRQGCHQNIGRDGFGRNVAMRNGKDWKGDVDPPVHERIDLIPGVENLEVERHVRMTGEEGPEDPAQHACRGGVAGSDRKTTGLSVSGLTSRGDRVVGFLEYPARLFEKSLARLRQCDKMSRSVKEIDSQLALEVLNLLGEGGLRDVKFLGSSAEVELVGDRNEVTQVPKLQTLPPSTPFLKLI